ncbi:hypothetical protein K492DRAFT_240441 [Lichtheimia hyalospora FSU 10163]|nr:hypothetical protein K492DRAFT_240441 [Lichtheimia hyalospora FSU 10163]
MNLASSNGSPSPSNNPLSDLIRTEKAYIDTLKIIDTELAPLLQNGAAAISDDLLDSVHDILVSNTRFYQRLTRIAANPDTIKELGDLLVQWVDDMHVPYTSFCENFAAESDICTKTEPALERRLKEISMRTNRQVSLSSLFSAPMEQLRYYKALYTRFLESAQPGRSDHKLLIKTIQRIDTTLEAMPAVPMACHRQEDQANDTHDDNGSPGLLSGIDCSGSVDLFTGMSKPYSITSTRKLGSVVLKDHFILLPEETHLSSPTRVQATLTTEMLILVDETAHTLLYAPISVDDLTSNSRNLDRELVGEYIVQLTIQGKKHLLLRADNRETRNKWVGVRPQAPSSTTLTPRSMRSVANGGGSQATPRIDTNARKSVIRKQDIFSYYQDQSGEISPLSSEEDEPITTSTNNGDAGVAHIRPKVPPLPISRKEDKHEVPTSAKSTQLLTPRPSPSSEDSGSSRGNSPVRPTTPRTIEISHAVAPVAAMQAITQTNDYLVPGAQQQQHRPLPPHPPMKQPTWPTPAAPINRSPSPGPPVTPSHQQVPPSQQQQQHLAPSQQQLRSQRSMPELVVTPRHHPPPLPNHQQQQTPQGKVLYNNGYCQVFRWKGQSWYGVDGQCQVQVRQMSTHRACLSIQMQHSGQLYLNAWILPSTVINHASPTDISVTVHMAMGKETYLIHLHAPQDANALYQSLLHTHQLALAADFLSNQDDDDKEPPQQEEATAVPQTERLVMQCKTKLFVQNEHAKWGSLGSGLVLRLSQQQPSKKMYIDIEDGKKKKLVSAMVQSRNVGQIGPKRITLLFITEKQAVVYMVQVKEEQTAAKLYQYLKTKNSDNGW